MDAEKRINMPFENALCLRHNRKFFEGKDTKFQHFFFKRSFSGKINLKQVEGQKKGSRGSGGVLSRKIFENSRTVMAILVHFEQISGKFY